MPAALTAAIPRAADGSRRRLCWCLRFRFRPQRGLGAFAIATFGHRVSEGVAIRWKVAQVDLARP